MKAKIKIHLKLIAALFSLTACGKMEGIKGAGDQGSTNSVSTQSIESGPTNYAHQKNGAYITGNELHSGFPLSSINDGVKSGRDWGRGGGWNSNNLVYSRPYIDVYFQTSIQIDRIVLYTLADDFAADPDQPDLTFYNWGLTSYEVYALRGGGVTHLGTVRGNQFVKSVMYPNFANTSAIRIVFTGAAGVGQPGLAYARITELEVYGRPSLDN